MGGCWALTAGCLCAAFAPSAAAENWRTSAYASAMETYTTNVNYAPGSQATSDWVTSLAAGFNVNGRGARVQLNGSVAATWNIYAGDTQNNSIAPSVNLSGSVEAIENFFFVDASANVSTSFVSPFGPQPPSLVNATNNRYISQTYSVSPYIRGVLGSSNISYQVRDDNIWTVASSFGNSSAKVPNTYGNQLSASMASGTRPVGWTLEYNRFEYDNGIPTDNSDHAGRAPDRAVPDRPAVAGVRQGRVRGQQVPPGGHPRKPRGRSTAPASSGVRRSAPKWGASGSTSSSAPSFSWQISHRLPNAAISANFTRGLSSFPQLALLIPAGVTVTQFLDAAFTTRIPDPAERALAVQEFLARTGLPPTLAAPVNVYGTTISLQNTQSISLVLIGVRNSVTFTAFNVESSTIGGTGEALPPQFQIGQNNTQTGIGMNFAYQLSGFTSLGANATYSTTRANDTSLANARSNNFSAGANASTRLGPKTTATAGVTYSLFQPVGGSTNQSDTSTINAFVGVSHTF